MNAFVQPQRWPCVLDGIASVRTLRSRRCCTTSAYSLPGPSKDLRQPWSWFRSRLVSCLAAYRPALRDPMRVEDRGPGLPLRIVDKRIGHRRLRASSERRRSSRTGSFQRACEKRPAGERFEPQGASVLGEATARGPSDCGASPADLASCRNPVAVVPEESQEK